jgi:hypothetical protein
VQINVRADIRQAQRYFSYLRRDAVHKAAARAINDVLVTVRAEGAREIKRAHPALRIRDIKQSMMATKANRNQLRAFIETVGKPLSLKLFGARATRKGVTARIGSGPRRIVMHHGRKAFKVAKYGDEIFVRRFARGRQIRRFRGPSLPGVFRAQVTKFRAIAAKRWPKVFANRMRFEIEKAKAVANR